MPFHYRLLGRDRMALFSFIQSLNTSFGISIFEPVASTLASVNHKKSEKQFTVGENISENAQLEIQNIIDELLNGKCSNKDNEVKRIRKSILKGKMVAKKPVKVDICIIDNSDTIHLFDIKTAKPNKSNFSDFKRTLLEWIAIYLTDNPNAHVKSYIAIPYNPYEPKPYVRWTTNKVIDLDRELKVGKDFWDFLGGEGAYEELLDCFERVGIELRPEIDAYFEKYK